MELRSLYKNWLDNFQNLPESYCYVIAEIGINHNGDINLAKQLIEMAKASGCDAVKFQKRTPEICVPKNQQSTLRDTPWGLISYLEYKKKIEFTFQEYQEINSYCSELQIEWSASAWDIPSQNFLKQFNLPFNKIASAMLTNIELLKVVAEEQKITFLSTGMSTLEEVDTAVQLFKSRECPLILMHTVSTYPASLSELNLRMISTLKKIYPEIPIAYSGHESNVSPSIIAVALGAVAVERHITLDRSSFGTDQSASLEKRGLEKLVSEIRRVRLVLGDGIKVVTEQEKEVAKKLRY
jgi:N-acetylneuraminate synthase